MSAMVSPLLWIRGKVRNVVEREVPAVEAVPPQPAQYDDRGALVRRFEPGREGAAAYTVHDVLIDTDRDDCEVPAGTVEVVITPRSAEATGGYLPTRGDEVEWPVRGYLKWVPSGPRRRPVNAYSLAGDVYAAEQKKAGKRSAPLAPAS